MLKRLTNFAVLFCGALGLSILMFCVGESINLHVAQLLPAMFVAQVAYFLCFRKLVTT